MVRPRAFANLPACMHEVVKLDWPKPVNSTRKVPCLLPRVVQVLQEPKSEDCELFGKHARVETGDKWLANALSPVEERSHRRRLVLGDEYSRVGVVHDDFTGTGRHRPDRFER